MGGISSPSLRMSLSEAITETNVRESFCFKIRPIFLLSLYKFIDAI